MHPSSILSGSVSSLIVIIHPKPCPSLYLLSCPAFPPLPLQHPRPSPQSDPSLAALPLDSNTRGNYARPHAQKHRNRCRKTSHSFHRHISHSRSPRLPSSPSRHRSPVPSSLPTPPCWGSPGKESSIRNTHSAPSVPPPPASRRLRTSSAAGKDDDTSERDASRGSASDRRLDRLRAKHRLCCYIDCTDIHLSSVSNGRRKSFRPLR